MIAAGLCWVVVALASPVSSSLGEKDPSWIGAARRRDDAVSPSRPGPAQVVARDPVPRMESARVQLAHATAAKLRLHASAGEARKNARETALRAYRAVREHFPEDAAVCAEAAFRAGELLRAADDAAGALAEFAIARERGARTPFRVRAMLEIGHVKRRARDHTAALAEYEAVLADAHATARARDDACWWMAHVFVELARVDDARRMWQRVADTAEDPLDRVRAYDALVVERIAAADLRGAAELLQRCRDALSEFAAEETKLGARVRSALLAMRAVAALERALAVRDARTDDIQRGRAR